MCFLRAARSQILSCQCMILYLFFFFLNKRFAIETDYIFDKL